MNVGKKILPYRLFRNESHRSYFHCWNQKDILFQIHIKGYTILDYLLLNSVENQYFGIFITNLKNNDLYDEYVEFTINNNDDFLRAYLCVFMEPENMDLVYNSKFRVAQDLVNKGDDYAEAADKADRFADIITRNKELPATTPKPKNGIEKAVGYVEQLVAVKKEHPEVWELVVGGIGGLVSGFLVKKDINEPSEATPANIDFDNLD